MALLMSTRSVAWIQSAMDVGTAFMSAMSGATTSSTTAAAAAVPSGQNDPQRHYTAAFETLLRGEITHAERQVELHTLSYVYLNKLSVCANLPVIVLSSVVGFLGPMNTFSGQSKLLGAVSIFVAILNTIENYFAWTKRSESHRLTALVYAKLAKFIAVQLQLEVSLRVPPTQLLALITHDIQTLKDSEPAVPQHIRARVTTRATMAAASPIMNDT